MEGFERRKGWWSLQPVTDPAIPAGDPAWSNHPIDRFLREAQMSRDSRWRRTPTLRLSYVGCSSCWSGCRQALREERQTFEKAFASNPAAAVAARVDSLLASPHFGERWARHWMDWLRYAEAQGGQENPTIENALNIAIHDPGTERRCLVSRFNQRTFGGRSFITATTNRSAIRNQ